MNFVFLHDCLETYFSSMTSLRLFSSISFGGFDFQHKQFFVLVKDFYLSKLLIGRFAIIRLFPMRRIARFASGADGRFIICSLQPMCEGFAVLIVLTFKPITSCLYIRNFFPEKIIHPFTSSYFTPDYHRF